MTENVTKKEVLEGISLTKDAAKRLIQIKTKKAVSYTHLTLPTTPYV